MLPTSSIWSESGLQLTPTCKGRALPPMPSRLLTTRCTPRRAFRPLPTTMPATSARARWRIFSTIWHREDTGTMTTWQNMPSAPPSISSITWASGATPRTTTSWHRSPIATTSSTTVIPRTTHGPSTCATNWMSPHGSERHLAPILTTARIPCRHSTR